MSNNPENQHQNLAEIRQSLENILSELKELKNKNASERYAIKEEHRLELFKTLHDTGRRAFQVVLLLNAGTAAAILTFIGTLTTKGPQNSQKTIQDLVGLQEFFIWGIVFAAFTGICLFVGQGLHHRGSFSKMKARDRYVFAGKRFYEAGSIFLLVSLVCFTWGAICASPVLARVGVSQNTNAPAELRPEK